MVTKMKNNDTDEDEIQEICNIMNEFQSDAWTEKQQSILKELNDGVLFDTDDFEKVFSDLQEKGNKIVNKKNYFIRG